MRDGNSRTPGGPPEPTGGTENDAAEVTESLGAPEGAGAEPGSVHVIVHSDRTRIVLSGEVDADLAPDLQEATADAEATGLPIEVDAQHVTFMDSSGIAFLARLATRTSERVRIIRAPETVRFLLDVTRIGELLDVVDDDDPDGPDDPDLPIIGPEGRRRRRPVPAGPDDVA